MSKRINKALVRVNIKNSNFYNNLTFWILIWYKSAVKPLNYETKGHLHIFKWAVDCLCKLTVRTVMQERPQRSDLNQLNLTLLSCSTHRRTWVRDRQSLRDHPSFITVTLPISKRPNWQSSFQELQANGRSCPLCCSSILHSLVSQ